MPPALLAVPVEGHGGLLERVVSRISRVFGVLAGLMLLYMFLHTMVEVALRDLFQSSTYVLQEFIGYALAAMTAFGLAETWRSGRIIRINMLTSRYGPRFRRVAEIVCAGVTVALLGYLCWFVWLNTARAWTRGSTSETIAEVPMWIPPAIALVGLLVFALQMLAYLVSQLRGGPYMIDGEGDI